MADAPVAAPVAPAPQAAPPAQAPSAVPPAKAADPGKQPPAQEPEKVAAPAPDVERRAATLARQKREAARIHAEKQKLETERRSFQSEQQEAIKAREQLAELNKLKESDKAAWLKAQGLDFNTLSQEVLRGMSGAGKTPQELVAAEVEKRLAEQAAETTAKQRADQERQNAQTLMGVQKQLEGLIAGNPERFELLAATGNVQTHVKDAWNLVVKFYNETTDPATGVGQQLDFGKALDAIEAREEARQSELLGKSKKVQALLEKQQKAEAEARAAAAEAAKKAASSTKTRGVEPRAVEATQDAPTQQSQPPRRRPPVIDVRKVAAELWAQHQAKHDN